MNQEKYSLKYHFLSEKYLLIRKNANGNSILYVLDSNFDKILKKLHLPNIKKIDKRKERWIVGGIFDNKIWLIDTIGKYWNLVSFKKEKNSKFSILINNPLDQEKANINSVLGKEVISWI